jgi:two-component system, NtrC family, sensor kinase
MGAIFRFRFTTVLLALLSLALVIFGIINFQQHGKYQVPSDGVSWVDSDQGVRAWIVEPNGPGYRAGVREGDELRAIDGQPIKYGVDATKAVFNAGVWSQAQYDLVRNGEPFKAVVVVGPQTDSGSLRHYLELVGLLYLFIGTFILLRRWTAPKSLHFYIFCLASFVLYTFSYTGKLNSFDWTIYWLNVAAWILQPALFLHFCLRFPQRPAFARGRAYIYPLLYVPGGLLLAAHLMVASNMLIFPFPLLQVRWLLDRMELIYLALYFLAGASVLEMSYRRSQVPLIKQQLKWVTRGTYLAVLPFAALYAIPYFLGFIPAPWMKLSALALVFLPLTFGYAIMRYRLMDVDIIFRRGVAYTLATATIVGLYFGLIALFADLFSTTLPNTGRGGWILSVIIAAIIFQPMANWIQSRLDRFFNRERYDYRRTLLEFARELAAELHLARLLDRVVTRLAETLGVDRLAIFLVTPSQGVRLAKSRGLALSATPDLGFLNSSREEFEKGHLFFDSTRHPFGFTPSEQETIEQLDLHYYLPFKMKEETLGYLGLGKTREGDFLSSEDVDLLRTIAGYVTIALENAQLYESLEQKARQYQALRDFNENIIESISVGVLACDLEHKIEAWNSPMEALYGLERSEAVGKRLEDVFPADLLATLPLLAEPRRAESFYKVRLSARDGRERIVNVTITPLVGKDETVIGRLISFNDLTERVNLEDQLMQSEKLSSIGLLAAGVAHEVNTPLAVITSQAQMLSRQLDADDPRSKTLEKITKQAFRASEIVNSLLKFSRVSGSEFSELDVNKIIRETLSLVEPMLKGSKISLNTQLTTALPAVYGNHGKLQQVFMNLIMNARDAMPRGGELTLATEAENGSVLVEVSDNGMGIPSEHLNKIFDPFFTTKSTSRGTGLGLAVSYGIIREHAGQIRVESVVGRGTSFRLEFPAARKEVNVS